MSFNGEVTSSTDENSLTGRVKWFNNKAGYGFINVTHGSRAGSDIFVHHSGINVGNEQYKYLVQGEYVNFTLEKAESGPHEYNASHVSGVNGGKLMCETRREFRLARNDYKTQASDSKDTSEVKTSRPVREQRQVSSRSRGEGPRESLSDKNEWTTVKHNKSTKSTERYIVNSEDRKRGRPARATVITIESK